MIAMAASAELAFNEASDSGSLLGGRKLKLKSDYMGLCRVTSAAEGLVSNGVVAIMGVTVL